MKKTLIAAVALAITASPIAVAHADTGYKVILNGQDISNPPQGHGTVFCSVGPSTEIRIQGVGGFVVTTAYQVVSVDISHSLGNGPYGPQGQSFHFDAGSPLGHGVATAGNAAATKNGKSYKITGNIAQGLAPQGSSTVPFEFDATCP